MSTAAVIVTFGRPDRLQAAVSSLAAQTVPVKCIYVMDNLGDVDPVSLQDRFSDVPIVVTAFSENIGPAGGFGAGMVKATDNGAEWVWLFNDDIVAEPDALEACLALAESMNGSSVGIVWPWNDAEGWIEYGYHWRRGPIRLERPLTSAPYRVDLVTFNGALVSRDLIDEIGVTRGDFFFGFWEWEYCLRALESGYETWVVPQIGVHHHHVGSSSFSPSWRLYYQTRNHLLLVMERKRPGELRYWLGRQLKYVARTLLFGPRRWSRAGARLTGAWHGWRGMSGKRLDPQSE